MSGRGQGQYSSLDDTVTCLVGPCVPGVAVEDRGGPILRPPLPLCAVDPIGRGASPQRFPLQWPVLLDAAQLTGVVTGAPSSSSKADVKVAGRLVMLQTLWTTPAGKV